MTVATATATRTIDVREIAPRERHKTLFAAFGGLEVGNRLGIVNDHDPRPLHHQFQAEAPGNVSWVCVENGPEVWRVSLQKLGRSRGAGDGCGVCGRGA